MLQYNALIEKLLHMADFIKQMIIWDYQCCSNTTCIHLKGKLVMEETK